MKRAERKLFFRCGIFISGGAENGVINKESVEVLSTLKPDLETWLIVDIPKEDFERIPGSSELAALFHKTMYLTECEAKVPGVFKLIAEESGASMPECLVLDCDLRRTVSSINNRLPAAIILDGKHLHREFLLRQLTEEEYIMHKRPV